MIDSILTAMSGLQGHQRGLNAISSNIANMNTPGFKGSQVDFTDVFSGGGGQSGAEGAPGHGVDSTRVSLDLRSGEIKQTGRELDLALAGDGFFVVRDEAGTLRYTRNGAFEFDDKGVLVGRGNAMKVLGHDASGKLVEIGLDGRRTNPPAATSEVLLSGNLSSTDTDHAIEELVVFDKLGGKHTLKLTFTNNGAVTPGSWVVAVFEGTKQLGTGELAFENGKPKGTGTKLTLAVSNGDPIEINFALDPDATGFSSGTTSTLAMKKQDGRASGDITGITFTDGGVMKIAYSNGQTIDGVTLALAEVADSAGLVADGAGLYLYEGVAEPTLRKAGDDLRVTAKSLEQSNVDLTSEFSALILMQRGYQASSQVVSTANEMLQQLFEMKGGR
jgi:flagellar hook protein FlgE